MTTHAHLKDLVCVRCGQPSLKRTCQACKMEKQRIKRSNGGWNPWRPGGQGRPPKRVDYVPLCACGQPSLKNKQACVRCIAIAQRMRTR